MKYIPIAFVVLLCGVVGAAAQTTSKGNLIDNPVYRNDCAKCHGKTGEGRHFGGPSLVSEKVSATSSEDLRSIITNGKHHVPKFEGKLTADEIDALVLEIKQSK